ncbi:MAG: response regulator transcription factor [Verrucomicrobiales bacterium]|nr:response regulator transcription factor [Verrucomicrobiales bacterium]
MTTILIIEDDEQTRENLQTILELEGFRPLTASDGAAGLEAVRRQIPDLILCDVMMPRLDGFGVLRELRGHPETAAVPFIFLTARGERKDQRIGMELGADDYLTKPASVDEVLRAVRTRLERETVRTATLRHRVAFQPDYSSPTPLEHAFHLTPREAEVLLWVTQGKSNPEIGLILGMAEKTVKVHLGHIFEKMGTDNRNAAAMQALEILCRLGATQASTRT